MAGQNRRGAPSIAKQIYEKVAKEVSDDSELYIVVIDMGGHVSQRFYQNVRRLQAEFGDRLERIQYSVYICKGILAAKAIAELAKYYDAKRIHIYKVAGVVEEYIKEKVIW